MNDELLPAELSITPEPFDDMALELEAESVQRWEPTDDDAAEWAMRKLAHSVDERDKLYARADNYRARIDEWVEHETKTLDNRIAFFQGHLEQYGLTVRIETEGARKTVSLPSGTIATRGSEAPVVELSDAEQLVAWAVLLPEPQRSLMVRPVPQPMKALREAITIQRKWACPACGEVTLAASAWCMAVECEGCENPLELIGLVAVLEGVDAFGVPRADEVPGVVVVVRDPTVSVSVAGQRALPPTRRFA